MKNIMITGASNGIGKATFDAIDKDLFDNIILIDKKNSDYCDEKTTSILCDIAKEEDVKRVFNFLDDKGIVITHAVNCAGVTGPSKTFSESTLEEFDKVMNVNLRGTFMMLKSQLEHMNKAMQGRIVNITSVLGSCAIAGGSQYGASKAGIIALTKHLAIEYAQKNILINCISPGGVDTDLIDDLRNSLGVEVLAQMHPVKRIATPDEIANYIKFMIETATTFQTGTEIFIDGGYSAQ